MGEVVNPEHQDHHEFVGLDPETAHWRTTAHLSPRHLACLAQNCHATSGVSWASLKHHLATEAERARHRHEMHKPLGPTARLDGVNHS